MFEKFGEMNSAAEINELADHLLNEGDFGSIKTLAAENGIGLEYAEMFIEGDIPMLCDVSTAAIGKIEIEAAEMQVAEIMADWVEYLKGQVMENAILAAKVRSKERSLKGMIGALLKWSFRNQRQIDKELLKEAGVTAGKVTIGIPGMKNAKEIILAYYLRGETVA